MSDAIKAAIEQYNVKLKRQEANLAGTQSVAKILGSDSTVEAKIARQKEAVANTKADIKKLEAALK